MGFDPTTMAGWPTYAAAAQALKDAATQTDQARAAAEIASAALAKANAAIESAAQAERDARVQLDAAHAELGAELGAAIVVAVATAEVAKL